MALYPLNLISICTGGAGLDLGVELAIPSARSVCMVEREAFACAQLVAAMEQGLLPQAALWSDARTFDGRPWRGLVDGLIGGIPCQPHSLAGRKGGSNDPRDLWSTARRIIVQSRARLVLIENVSGMLSAGADEIAGAERVWRDLRKLGYAVEGGLFTASEVGASHRRERLFILGVADGGSDGQQRRAQQNIRTVQPEQQAPRWDDAERRNRPLADDESGGWGNGGLTGTPQGGRSRIEDAVALWPTPAARDHKGANSEEHLENGTGRKHLDQLPNFVEHLWSTPRSSDAEKGGPNQKFGAGGTPLPSQAMQWATPTQVHRKSAKAMLPSSEGGQSSPPGIEQQAETLAYSRPDLTITTVGETHSRPRRSLNPLFVEWLMGWPPGWTLLAWTDFACSAMALCLWRQRMRSALSSLTLPQEAPAAQLSLFG